jgi:mannobiose 2-epimerase
MNHALDILRIDKEKYSCDFHTIFNHTVRNGIDTEFGGVYVEGPHSGGVSDREKEFWQQAEVLTAMLDAYIMFRDPVYWESYKNVHRFVFDKVINKKVGEWYPLLTREGLPIWTHMGHSWKINYHTVRSMILSVQKMNRILSEM